MDFRFLFALYSNTTGQPPTAEDCTAYAQQVGMTNIPVFGDATRQIAAATPMTQERHPEMCALTPSLRIIGCYAGHGAYEQAFNDIRIHAGL